jgi:hypothetical protein
MIDMETTQMNTLDVANTIVEQLGLADGCYTFGNQRLAIMLTLTSGVISS